MAYDKDGKPLANSWQGIFPFYNTEEDGYAGTAPVGCSRRTLTGSTTCSATSGQSSMR
jgi:hypothetical protein